MAAKFHLGNLYSTPDALEAIESASQSPTEFLKRHIMGDWGDCDAEDSQANEDALVNGDRIFSVYHTRNGVKLWIITEADRASTTILLPSEY